MKVLDLTHTIRAEMPVYPGTEPPELTAANTYAADGFQETLLRMYSHTGTHIDPPAHLFAGARTLDRYPAAQFLRRALVIDCRMLREAVESSSLTPLEVLERMNGSLGHLRITLVEPDGSVAYDSGSAPAEMESHLLRPEVQEALELGWGEDQRTSDTPGESTTYCAA